MRSFPPLCAGAIFFCMSWCASAGTVSVQILSQKSTPVSNAGIYATRVGTPPSASPRREVSIEQIGKEFVPLVSVVQTGTMVNFPNRDTVRHHVYSFSSAKSFELKLYSGVPAKPVLFDKPGEVVLGCNIHDNMIAYLLVVDTPFFGKSDDKGRAKLDGLPAGDYDVSMWYAGGVKVAPVQRIRVGTTDNVDVKFVFDPVAASAPPAK